MLRGILRTLSSNNLQLHWWHTTFLRNLDRQAIELCEFTLANCIIWKSLAVALLGGYKSCLKFKKCSMCCVQFVNGIKYITSRSFMSLRLDKWPKRPRYWADTHFGLDKKKCVFLKPISVISSGGSGPSSALVGFLNHRETVSKPIKTWLSDYRLT